MHLFSTRLDKTLIEMSVSIILNRFQLDDGRFLLCSFGSRLIKDAVFFLILSERSDRLLKVLRLVVIILLAAKM